MKKIVGIILCLVAVGGTGFYFLIHKKTVRNQYARFLPQNVVATLNLTHCTTLTDSFAASPLGRFLAKETMHAIVQEMGGQAKDTAEYDRLHDAVTEVTGDPAFRAVFGDDATLALLPPDRASLARMPAETLRHSLVVVAQTSAAGALDLLSRLIKNAHISRETVDGLDLVKIALDKNQVLYGYAEGKTVLLAYAPAAIKTCLASGKSENALDKAALFQEALVFWQPYPEATTYSRMYLNVPAVADLLKTATAPEIKESGEMLTGVDSMYSITYGTDQGLESRGRSGYRYEQLHAMVKSAVDAATGSNQSLHLLQDKVLAYNWASSLRPELLAKAMAANEKEYREIDTELRKNLGVSLDELGRAFGPQYGVVLDDIVRTPLFPAPKMTLFFGIRDRKIAETALAGLRRLIAQSGMASEEKEVVAGQTISSWPVLPGEMLQPTFVLTDSMLYLATSKQALKDILASKATPNALPAPVGEHLGAELSGRVSTANFGSFVLYPQRMAKQTGETIDWLAGILAASKNISVSRLNRELVQLMQSAELVVATSNLGKDQAEWSMTIRKAPAQPAGTSTK
jgi:hypothetical protein